MMKLKRTLILAGLAAVASSALFIGCGHEETRAEGGMAALRELATNSGPLYMIFTNPPEIEKGTDGTWRVRVR
jgi:hypothetical protein